MDSKASGSVHKKSTNVRASAMVRLGVGALSAVAPPLAVRLAEHLFTTPPRVLPFGRDEELLAMGRSLSIPFRVPLRAWSLGQGPRVLLMHGWGGRLGQLSSFIAPLYRAGFQVIAFDAPAHGQSGGRHSSLFHFRDAILAVADQVGPLHGVVAHSMGGAGTAVALDAGLSLNRAVFIGSPVRLSEMSRRFSEFIGLPDEVRSEMERRLEIRYHVKWNKVSVAEFAPRMTVPLLVFHDRGDVEVPFTDGAALAQLWPGAELVPTSALGHRRILRDRAVIERSVAFLTIQSGAAENGSFATCTHGTDERLCSTCTLERELYERDTRVHAPA